MVVGICTVELRLPGALTLKDKRRVIKGLLERVRHRYQVAAAEVDHQGHRSRATLGIACVSNAGAHADQILAAVVRFIETQADLELLDYHTEIL
ncbi:MAG TPA: DUF503 domain-containing protein [Peptococcaceae bacterium]|nr:MAG: hypothetical protein XD51_1140 [Moorella sp. 60_41]HBT46261.1 DUF503 domain-containing protein [Peptococcaceae bacterium]